MTTWGVRTVTARVRCCYGVSPSDFHARCCAASFLKWDRTSERQDVGNSEMWNKRKKRFFSHIIVRDLCIELIDSCVMRSSSKTCRRAASRRPDVSHTVSEFLRILFYFVFRHFLICLFFCDFFLLWFVGWLSTAIRVRINMRCINSAITHSHSIAAASFRISG